MLNQDHYVLFHLKTPACCVRQLLPGSLWKAGIISMSMPSQGYPGDLVPASSPGHPVSCSLRPQALQKGARTLAEEEPAVSEPRTFLPFSLF